MIYTIIYELAIIIPIFVAGFVVGVVWMLNNSNVNKWWEK